MKKEKRTMKIKDIRQAIKGLSGDLDCEFEIHCSSEGLTSKCKEVDIKVEEERNWREKKVIKKIVFRGWEQ